MKNYKAKEGSRISDKDALIIGKEIEKLSSSGVISEEVLVSAAQDEGSPIHHYFEWDNRIAAEKYRLEQARSLIRSIVIETDNGEEVRAFHNVYLEDIDAQDYVDLDRTLHSPDLWLQVLESALRQAEAWSRRYATYKELQPIVKAINKTAVKLKGKKHGKETRSAAGRRKDYAAEARL